MKKALISPNEPCEQGYRIAQVSSELFEVALPLFWVSCSDEIAADQFWFDPADEQIKPLPAPSTDAQPTVQGAQTL